ncbi:MAG: hypothetical protein J5838_01090 [Desulfovibrio sp.]|nr:hypothetical protein [Desulfovibrio sp.]
MAEDLDNLAAFLKRKALGLSHEEFAKQSGLSLTLVRTSNETRQSNPVNTCQNRRNL